MPPTPDASSGQPRDFLLQPLRLPACPTLLLSASGDRLVNPRYSQVVASAWQAAHQIHPRAGHDLPHDDADWVCQQVANWLDKP